MEAIRSFDTSSNRVLLATFDRNWERQLSDGHVVYTATANNAEVKLLLVGGQTQRLVFRKGRQIFAVAGTFHFPPHIYYITG